MNSAQVITIRLTPSVAADMASRGILDHLDLEPGPIDLTPEDAAEMLSDAAHQCADDGCGPFHNIGTRRAYRTLTDRLRDAGAAAYEPPPPAPTVELGTLPTGTRIQYRNRYGYITRATVTGAARPGGVPITTSDGAELAWPADRGVSPL